MKSWLILGMCMMLLISSAWSVEDQSQYPSIDPETAQPPSNEQKAGFYSDKHYFGASQPASPSPDEPGNNVPSAPTTTTPLVTRQDFKDGAKIDGPNFDVERDGDTWSGTVFGVDVSGLSDADIMEAVENAARASSDNTFTLTQEGEQKGHSPENNRFGDTGASTASLLSPERANSYIFHQAVLDGINKEIDGMETEWNADSFASDADKDQARDDLIEYYRWRRAEISTQKGIIIDQMGDKNLPDAQKDNLNDELFNKIKEDGQALVDQYRIEPKGWKEFLISFFNPDLGSQTAGDWLKKNVNWVNKGYGELNKYFTEDLPLPDWLGNDPANAWCQEKYKPTAPGRNQHQWGNNPTHGWGNPDFGRMNIAMFAWRRENKDENGVPLTDYCIRNGVIVACSECPSCTKKKFPTTDQAATWYPTLETDPPEPKGYLYHFEWIVTNPYSTDEIKDGIDRRGEPIPDGILGKDGNISFTVELSCTSCDKNLVTGTTIGGETLRTKYIFDPNPIPPGKASQHVFEDFSLNYYDHICLRFHHGFKMNDQYSSHPPECKPEKGEEAFGFTMGLVKEYEPDLVLAASVQGREGEEGGDQEFDP
ncbi:MAG: hypothetical protein ABIH34_02540 [Nanoarchaeota archaeon]